MEDQLMQLGQEWTAAEERGDVAALERMLADDFVGIGPFGFMLTKEQWLARYRSDDLRNESVTLDEVSVRSYGEVAVIVGRQTQRTFFQGRDVSGRFRTTLICVRQAGDWRIAGWQASGPIPDAPPNRA
jgi:ketosteroid isomerase-like protein